MNRKRKEQEDDEDETQTSGPSPLSSERCQRASGPLIPRNRDAAKAVLGVIARATARVPRKQINTLIESLRKERQ
jgi:hypothetical protein